MPDLPLAALEVLLIQDDAHAAASVRDALLQSSVRPFKVTWVRSCADGLAQLGRAAAAGRCTPQVAAVLVDLFLPDSEGLDTYHRLAAASPHTPLVVLCSRRHEDTARIAVERGASEYVLLEQAGESLLAKLIDGIVACAAMQRALFGEQERARVTLASIADGVISTGVDGRITYLNAVAETMTGWTCAEATGLPLDAVLRIVDRTTRTPIVDPMAQAPLRGDGLAPGCLLIRRDGTPTPVEDSVAPIHDRHHKLAGAVMVLRDACGAQARSTQLSYQAQHDALTRLPDRALLHARLTQAMALARRHQQKVAVLLLDLDRFKTVNDALGHEVGDRLLQSVAARLLQCLRESDTVCRLGGDEFVVLLAEIHKARDAAVPADRILLATAQPQQLGEHPLQISASIGIAIYPDDGDDASGLIACADSAMYHAKDGGRNNYQFYLPPDGEAAAPPHYLPL